MPCYMQSLAEVPQRLVIKSMSPYVGPSTAYKFCLDQHCECRAQHSRRHRAPPTTYFNKSRVRVDVAAPRRYRRRIERYDILRLRPVYPADQTTSPHTYALVSKNATRPDRVTPTNKARAALDRHLAVAVVVCAVGYGGTDDVVPPLVTVRAKRVL